MKYTITRLPEERWDKRKIYGRRCFTIYDVNTMIDSAEDLAAAETLALRYANEKSETIDVCSEVHVYKWSYQWLHEDDRSPHTKHWYWDCIDDCVDTKHHKTVEPNIGARTDD